MKLVTFKHGSATGIGLILKDGRILDLAKAAGAAGASLPGDMIGFIAAGESALATARKLEDSALSGKSAGAILAASDVKLLAPIPRPLKNVFCIGRNYVDHIAEGHRARGTEVKLPEVPQIFTKPPTAVIGPGDNFVVDDKLSQKYDYEVELGVIIGTTGSYISGAKAFDHVFGYTIINDLTARDLQRKHDQWFKGKGLDRSCPIGPYILTKDEVPDPTVLELTLTVNGEQRQNAKVGQMIFNISQIIESLSAGLTLEAGDVIATGTPSGVGFAMEPPQFLKPGDTVVCKISQLGELVTPVTGR